MTTEGSAQEFYDKQLVTSNSPPPEEGKLVDYVKRQVISAEQVQRAEDRQDWISLMFLSGRQWIRFNDGTWSIIDRPQEDWEVRLVNNHVRQVVENITAKVCENDPSAVCLPATDDDEDSQKALACERLLTHYRRELKFQVKIREFVKLAVACGIGWLKLGWDPDGGDEVLPASRDEAALMQRFDIPEEADVVDELPDEPPAFNGEGGDATPREGMPVVEVLTPFEVRIDPGAKDVEHARWAAHVTSMHVDELHERWPDQAAHVRADHYFVGDMVSERLHLEVKGQYLNKNEANRDRVRVVEYYEKPSRRHPEGLYAVVAGERLMERGPLVFKKLPFVCARHLAIPSKIHGDGAVKDLIGPQEEINVRVSTQSEHANQMSAPKWWAPKGSGIGSRISNKPGEVLETDPMLPRPAPIPPPPFSPVERQIQESQVEVIRQISGLANIVFGQIPSGLSGRAIGFWQEQVASALSGTVTEVETAIAEVLHRILEYHRDYGQPAKTVRIIGINNAVEVREFYRDDIRSTDVYVVRGSMLPENRNYKREQVMAAYTSGVLGNPQDPLVGQKARKLMKWGDLDALYGDESRDRRYAREENLFLARGEILAPQGWEDHSVHRDEHLEYMKSGKFRLLPPEIQQAFAWHIAWTDYFMSLIQGGYPHWLLQPQPFPTLPPPPQTPPPQQTSAPTMMPLQPGQRYDAEGPEPPVEAGPINGPPGGGTQMDPMALLAMAQAGGQGAPSMPPELARVFPSGMAHGPGVGDMEQVGGIV